MLVCETIRIPKFYYVYVITNLITNKQYVGSRVCYKDKIEDDIYWSSSKYLIEDIQKFGINNFTKKILKSDYKTKQELLDGESEYILSYNTLTPNGYNRFIPNKKYGFHFLGCQHSEETRKKFKKPKSEEHKQKLKGPKSDKHKQHMSDKHANVSGNNNPMYGKSVYDVWLEKYGEEKAYQKMEQSYTSIPKERKDKISINVKEVMKSEIIRQKIRKSKEGKSLSDEHRNKIGLGVKGKTKGIPKSAEQKEKIKNTLKNKPKLMCPICKKIMDPSNFKKYGHGENCNK